jgi:hypothetical protein
MKATAYVFDVLSRDLCPARVRPIIPQTSQQTVYLRTIRHLLKAYVA